MSFMNYRALILCTSVMALATSATFAQQRVAVIQQASEDVQIRAPRFTFTCRTGTCVETYTGDVEVRLGPYLIQADKVIRYKGETRVVAEGNVIFFHRSQRTKGSRLEWNYGTRQKISFDTTGFKGRKSFKKAISDSRLEEAIKKAYELPGELLRRDSEDLNRTQSGTSPTPHPPTQCNPR